MTRSARVLMVLTLVLLAILWIAWARLEWVELEVDTGYGAAARRNAFLAAEQFLNAQGVETQTVEGVALLDALPPIADALVITAPRESLGARRRDAVVEWVESGGVLFAVSHSVYDFDEEASADGLLDAFGVHLVDPEQEQEREEEPEPGAETESDGFGDEGPAVEDALEERMDSLEDGRVEEDDAARPETLGELLRATFRKERCRTDEEGLDAIAIGPPVDDEMRLELSGGLVLRVQPDRVDDAYFSREAQLVSMRHGDGLVVVLTSAVPFTNPRIHCHDHAWFLWFSLEDRRKVWMLHDPEAPGLTFLALSAMPGTTIGAGLLIVLLGAVASIRFGRPDRSDRGERRGRLTHLESAVRFQFQRGGFQQLFRRLQADLEARGPRDRAAWAERAGLAEEQVEQVFGADLPRGRRVLVARVRAMIRMRRTR